MKFYSSKISVSKPITPEQAVANAKAQPKVRSLEEIIASAQQIKEAASAKATKTASSQPPVQVKVGQFTETSEASPAPEETPAPLDAAAPIDGGIPAPEDAAIPPAPAPLPPAPEAALPGDPAVLPPEPIPAPVPAAPAAAAAPAPAPIPPAPKATPKPLPITPEPLDIAASFKKTLKMAKSVNFTAWPEEQKVIDHWNSFGSHEKCVAGIAGKTNNPEAYCKLLSKAASMASEQLVKKAAAAKATKVAEKQEKVASPAFKRFAKLTEKEQAFLRNFFSKIYGKEYVTALLGDY